MGMFDDPKGYDRNSGRRTLSPVRADRFVDELADYCRTNGCATISLRIFPMVRKTGSWVKDVQVSPVRVDWTPENANDSLYNFLQENPTGELTLDTRYSVDAFDDHEMVARTTVDFSENQSGGAGRPQNTSDKIARAIAARTEQMVDAMLGLGGGQQGGGATLGGFNTVPYGMVRVGDSEYVPASEVGSVIELERTRNRELADRLERLEKKAEKSSGILGPALESMVERAMDIGERYLEKRISNVDEEAPPSRRRRRTAGQRRSRRHHEEEYDDDYEDAAEEADEPEDEYEDEDDDYEDEAPAPRRQRQARQRPRGRRVAPSVGMDTHFDPIDTAAGREYDEDDDYDEDGYDEDTDAPFYSALDDDVLDEVEEAPPPTVGGARKKLTEERMVRVVRAVYETLYKHCGENYTFADMTTRFKEIKRQCVRLAKDVFGPAALSHNMTRQDMTLLTADPGSFYELVMRLLPAEAQQNRIILPAIKRVLKEFCENTNWSAYIDEVWG